VNQQQSNPSAAKHKSKTKKPKHMKTSTKFILAGLATALFATGSSMAGDLQVIDNHHGSYIYPYRPAQTWPTVAFTGHRKGLGSANISVKRTEEKPASEPNLGIRAIMTAHGTVSYYAPVE
jgi:hypothetical protein